MIELILFIMASIGLTNIIVEGAVVQPIKNWLGAQSLTSSFKWIIDKFLYMSNCYQCAGFWTGMLCGWLLGYDIFLSGCAGSFLGMFGYYMFAVALKVSR